MAKMGEGRRDEEVASSKIIDTLFMTKMAEKWLNSIPNL